MRRILIVEPGFKTKFPPLGLMKISQYHKHIGDKVYFVKGSSLPSEYYHFFWDKIYINTVFTFNWKITVDTILYYKDLLGGDIGKIYVGGILATLMPDELWEATGVYPITGLLSDNTKVDENGEKAIDQFIPDYDLFNDVDIKYDLLDDSYLGYTTRGCINKCDFCGVPSLEPTFCNYINIKDQVEEIKKMYGEKKNLVLLDNNVLASDYFERIISDIRELGFEKGAKLNRRLREVDFNQGVDARLITDEKIKLLSSINIKPLRIAFDNIKYKDIYIRSIKLAAKHNIRHLSNYILYNHSDKPEDLWERLKINIDLNKELDLRIWSFPMKYIPLRGPESKYRRYVSRPHWNHQYIRGVQRILNVLKGAVSGKEDFFYRAFGESKEDFKTILMMPEQILMNRGRVTSNEEFIWRKKYAALNDKEKNELLNILDNNRTSKAVANTYLEVKNKKIKDILEMYITYENKSQLSLSIQEES